MDQVKKLLAQYVEWIALALGVAFLGWMIYGYVVQQPVTVAVGPSAAVPPGNIDRVIWEQAASKLSEQTKGTGTVPIPVRPYGTEVAENMRTPWPDVGSLVGLWDHSSPVQAPGELPVAGNVKVPPPSLVKVTGKPSVPKATGLVFAIGHSNVPADALAPQQPGMPPAAPAAPAAATDRDITWVSVGFNIPSTSALAQAFADVKITSKSDLGATVVLAVDGYRQERQPDGSWGPTVKLAKPAAIAAVQPLPPAEVPNLAANSTATQVAFANYAIASEPLILRPEFYKVAQGDVWYVPGTKNPNEKAITLVDDAPKAAPPTRRPTTPRPPKPPSMPRGGPAGGMPGGGGRSGGGGGGGGGGHFAPVDPSRPGGTPMDGLYGSQPNRPTADQPPTAPGETPDAPTADLPKVPFIPANTPDFLAWLHDDTVVPGKTYRYMVQYVIQNPVFNTVGQCQKQTDANTFALTSEPSDWSGPVDVASDTNFFATLDRHNGVIQFEIFKWRNGAWTKQTVFAADGDPVGTVDPKVQDPKLASAFVTGWTLVDVRDVPLDPSNKTILLASDNGTLQRELKVDQHDQRYRQLEAAVNSGAAAQPPAAGPTFPFGPGGPPRGGMRGFGGGQGPGMPAGAAN